MENNNESEKLGLQREPSCESPMLQRRSSMKMHRSSIKEPSFGVKFPPNKTGLKRKITWTSEVDEEEAKTPDKKYRDSKTFYSDSSVNKI